MSPRADLDLSLVVINSNGRELLRDCLASLPGACEGITWEAIVVDNGSTDGSPDMVRESFPDAVFIGNAENRGFTRANNQGFKVARGRWMVMLNNDTECRPRSFADAVHWLDEHPDVGAAGLKLLNRDGSRQLSCRRFPNFTQAFFSRYSLLTRLFPNNPYSAKYLMSDLDLETDKPIDVDWVSGACLIFSREVSDHIGFLDERYWMYSEDVDYCLRVWQMGKRVVFLPFGEVMHYIGQDTSNYPYLLMFERHRSMYRYYKKHYSRELLFVDIATAIMIGCRCATQMVGIFFKGITKPKRRVGAAA